MPNLSIFRATYSNRLDVVPTREELPLVLNARGLFGCAVEVGVQAGVYSAHLLASWKGSHLISVDPWAEDDPAAYVDIANRPQQAQEALYAATCRRLAPFGERSTIWRTTSLAAAARLPHHTLDFVYLDARHDYASVREDLEAWFDRVRPGGILAGHDYLDGRLTAGEFGVKRAVNEFFGARGLPVHATIVDRPWVSWMVAIPTPGA